MSKAKLPCPIPPCKERFGSAVALDFHVREDHPGRTLDARGAVNAAYRARDRIRQDAAEVRARRLLDALYKSGCPCGRSYAAHLAVRASAPLTQAVSAGPAGGRGDA